MSSCGFSIEMLNDSTDSIRLVHSEYCRENYEPVGSDRDVNDS